MKFVYLLAALSLSTSAFAAEIPASQCQIFIKSVKLSPSSHGSLNVGALVKVNWLGNGEFIEKVGFRFHRLATDLGNDPNRCQGLIYSADSGWSDLDPMPGQWADAYTQPGEYYFSFQIQTGSVISWCPGATFSNEGAFFVRTNKNTYWLNPDLDSSKNFVFDPNGAEILRTKGATWQARPTTTDDMKYYNPASCR